MIDDTTELPEGTDTIITGASATAADAAQPGAGGTESATSAENSAAAKAAEALRAARETLRGETDGLRAQATEKFRAYAVQGKDRTTDALDNVVALVNDAADTVEEKLGPQYAGYARSAAGSISGVAETLRGKDVDELIEDAKEIVRNSPAIAIGTAAVLGFALARVLKANPTEGDTGAA